MNIEIAQFRAMPRRMPHNEEDPIMGKQSTPPPAKQPVFNDKADRMGQPPKRGK
jgi:hypothetical protein